MTDPNTQIKEVQIADVEKSQEPKSPELEDSQLDKVAGGCDDFATPMDETGLFAPP